MIWKVCPLLFVAAAVVSAQGIPVARPKASDLAALSLENLMGLTVRTASLHQQSLEEAPALATVITAAQIRERGYRSLGEALAGVRGFYASSDGELLYIGVRGFSLPGDYNTRFLVMINGHQMTDNVFSAMYLFGQEFGLDMDLVEKIEVVRGPSSALYGSNGVFATVNVITASPANPPRARASATFGSLGERRLAISSSLALGPGARLLFSAAGYENGGWTIAAPELSARGPGYGRTDGVGKRRGYHFFANFVRNNWSVTAKFGDSRANLPQGLYGTVFGDSASRTNDTHNFIDASWRRNAGPSGEMNWRIFYDQFRYYSRQDYSRDDGVLEDIRDLAKGDWIGSEFSYRHLLPRLGTLTVGTRVTLDIRNLQQDFAVAPLARSILDASHSNRTAGLFAQQECDLSGRWKLYLGIRLDDSRDNPAFVSPRAALVYKRTPNTTYKLLYGRSFRNPSTYERFYEPSPGLGPEKMHTFELAREQRVARRMDLIASVYHYRLDGLIEGVPIPDNLLRFENVTKTQATGVEIEFAGHPAWWLETSASLSVQKARNMSHHEGLPNSPERLAQFRAGVPLWRDRLHLTSFARYFSSRRTLYASTAGPVLLVDLTATTRRLHPDFDLQFGVRNLADRRYADPQSTEHAVQFLPREGRTFYCGIIWNWRR